MKFVVLELRDDRAAVLDEEGIVRVIQNRQYQIGQKLDLNLSSLAEPHSMSAFLQKRLLPAAAAIAILFAGGSFAAVNIPFSSVTVSGSNIASVKYDLNAFDQVLSVSAESEEGKPIAEELQRSVKGASLSAALDTTLDMMEKQGLLEQESETISVSVKGSAVLKKGLNNQVQTRVDSWKKEIREKQQHWPELSPQDNTADHSEEYAVPMSGNEASSDITPDTDRLSSAPNGVDEKSDAGDNKNQMNDGSGVPPDMQQSRDISPEENHPAASDPQERPPQNNF